MKKEPNNTHKAYGTVTINLPFVFLLLLPRMLSLPLPLRLSLPLSPPHSSVSLSLSLPFSLSIPLGKQAFSAHVVTICNFTGTHTVSVIFAISRRAVACRNLSYSLSLDPWDSVVVRKEKTVWGGLAELFVES